MADFQKAALKTLEYEGGLVENPHDPGGLTNFGISIHAHPELTLGQIRNMTQAQAVLIYRDKYWPPLYDQISDQVLANQLFDFGVNAGVHRAVQTLQGVIFFHGGPALDGFFGARTLACCNETPQKIVRRYVLERIRYYYGLNKPEFLHAWLDRTIDGMLP